MLAVSLTRQLIKFHLYVLFILLRAGHPGLRDYGDSSWQVEAVAVFPCKELLSQFAQSQQYILHWMWSEKNPIWQRLVFEVIVFFLSPVGYRSPVLVNITLFSTNYLQNTCYSNLISPLPHLCPIMGCLHHGRKNTCLYQMLLMWQHNYSTTFLCIQYF